MSASSRSYKRKTDELDGINPLACSSMDTWNTGSSLKKPSSTWETGTMNFSNWTPNTDPRLAGNNVASAGGSTPSATAEQMNAYNAFLQMQMMQMMNPAMAMMNTGMMMNAQNLAAMSVMQTAPAVADKSAKPITKAPLTYGEYKRLQRMKSDPSYGDDYPSSNHSYNRSTSMDGYRGHRDTELDIKQERDYPVVDRREHELQKQLELQRQQLERQQQQLLLQQQQLLQLQERQKQALLNKQHVGEEEWDDPVVPAPPPEEDFGRNRRGRDRDDVSPRKRGRSRSRSRERDDYDRRRRDDRMDDDRRNRGRNFSTRGRFGRDDRRYRDDDRRDRDFGGRSRGRWNSPPKKSTRFSRERDSGPKIKQEEDWDDTPAPATAKKPAEDNWDDSPPKNDAANDFWNTEERPRDRGGRANHEARRGRPERKNRWGDREPARKPAQDENWDDEEQAPKVWGNGTKETNNDNWDDDEELGRSKKSNDKPSNPLMEENWDDEEMDGPAKWVEPVAPKPVEQDDEEDWDNEDFGPQNEWIDRPADLPAITDDLLNVKPAVAVPVPENDAWEEEEKKLAEKRKALDEENWDDDEEPLVEEPWTTVVNPGVKLLEGTKAVIINGNMYLAPATPILKPVPPPLVQPEPLPDDFDLDEEFYPPDWVTKEKEKEDSMECVEMEIADDEEIVDESLVPPGLSDLEFEDLKKECSKIPPKDYADELEREERERLELERLEREKLEREKLEKEKLEREKLEREKLEKEKLEREMEVAEKSDDEYSLDSVEIEDKLNDDQEKETIEKAIVKEKTPENVREKTPEKPSVEPDDDSDLESLDFDWDIKDFGSPSKFIKQEKESEESDAVIELDDNSNDAPRVEIKKEIKVEPEELQKIPEVSKLNIKVEEIEIKSEIDIEAPKLTRTPKKNSRKEIFNDEQIKSELEMSEFRMNDEKGGEVVEWDDGNVATEVELIEEIPLEEEKPQKAQAKAKKAPPKKRRRRKAWTTKRKKKPAAKKATVVEEVLEEEEDDDSEIDE